MIKEWIIHQVWVGPNPAPVKWMQTWKDMHPTWTYMLWDDAAVKKYPFINRRWINHCMARGLFAGVSDIIGYEILHDFGGVLVPADTECLLPLDELMDINEDFFTAYVWEYGSE
jgi:mannosyltransferase OCH1-like enzyme